MVGDQRMERPRHAGEHPRAIGITPRITWLEAWCGTLCRAGVTRLDGFEYYE